eukprot:4050347-Pyramimonas_sp.AAC.1
MTCARQMARPIRRHTLKQPSPARRSASRRGARPTRVAWRARKTVFSDSRDARCKQRPARSRGSPWGPLV